MNPLIALHKQANAETQPYGDIEIVSTFGQMPAEYAAVRKRVGMMDLPQRGIIEVTGKDRLTFLNNLVSNQTFDKQTKTGLQAGQGVYAFLLNAKSGRIITDLNIQELGDRTYLELEQRMIVPVIAALEKYLFAEQVKLESKAETLHQIALHGPEHDLPDLAPGANTQLELFGIKLTAWRDDPTGTPGYHLIVPTEQAEKLWTMLLGRPIRPIGWQAFNATRIEAARPMFGIDFDDSILPHETGPLLNRAVSFTKGCYPGQEIVARMHARGGTAKNLVGIKMSGEELPIAGTKIYDDNHNEIGGVTSSTVSPVLSNAALCLAILKRPHFNVGTEVTIPAEGQMRKGTVTTLPFLAKPE